MTASLLASLGVYGAIAVIGFIAGMFPIVSIEVFLVGLSYARTPAVAELALWIVLAAVGHQVAKTLCYFGGEAALEHGKLKPRIDGLRTRIERWNKQPIWIMSLAATVGLPPMYVLAFVAHPLMAFRFWPFTLICFVGRIGRYAFLAGIPLIAR